MSKGHAVLKFLRKVHLYVGIFTTPALLFFAITGALQTFSLHETTQGSNYKPPAWIESLAQLHKKRTTVVPPRRARPAAPEASAPTDASRATAAESGAPVTTQPQPVAPRSSRAVEASAPRKSHLPMKVFFLLVSLSLVTSTLTGIYLSYEYSPGWWVLTGLLVAGVVVPLLLLPF
jgi:uncharacterized iron-regulated membrane protein